MFWTKMEFDVPNLSKLYDFNSFGTKVICRCINFNFFGGTIVYGGIHLPHLWIHKFPWPTLWTTGKLQICKYIWTTGNLRIHKFPWHEFLKNSKYLLSNMGEILRKFSKNQVIEIYESISFQSSVSTYRSVTFQLSVKSFTDP